MKALAASLARALLVLAVGLGLAALVLVVIAYRLLTWPHRKTTPAGKLEAAITAFAALSGLIAMLRPREKSAGGADSGGLEQVVGTDEPVGL